MHVFIIWFCLLSCFSILLSGGLPVPNSPLASGAPNGTSDGIMASPNASPISPMSVSPHNHVQELANASHDSQTGVVATFPKYAVVLLALFIVVCAIASAAVIVFFYAQSTRERVIKIARHVLSPSTSTRPPVTGRKENTVDNDKNYKHEEKVLDITQNTSGFSVPTETGDISKTESTAATSVEKVDTSITLSTGDVSTSNDKVKETESGPPSPRVSRHSGSPKSSSSPEVLRKLISASTNMLLHLTNLIPPTDATDAVSGIETPSIKTEHTSNTEATSLRTIRTTITTPGDDNSSTHTGGSQRSTSSTAFYSLGDVLSPSAAVHSLVDLAALSNTREMDSTAEYGSPERFEESDIADELISPRYVPGVQLETIQEESESSASLYSQLTRPVSSRKSFLDSIDFDKPTQRTTSMHSEDTSKEYTRLSASISLTDRIPATWEELAIDPQNASVPRFYPAARSAPSPSEPLSTVSVVSALRSPYRQERRHSVAWLSPVIEWAVDDPREPLEEGEPVVAEEEDECEDAVNAADAMAVVMDSLAAIGMDPMDMLTAEGTTSPSLSPDSSPQHADTLEPPNDNPQPQTAAADQIEEDEVEMEIGVDSEPKSPMESPLAARGTREGDLPIYDIFSFPPALPSFGKASEAFTSSHDLGKPGDIFDDIKSARRAEHRKSTGSPIEQYPRTSSRRSKSIGDVGSPSDSQTFRTPRGVKPDRAYPSPSSLAGLSPAEVTKRFSAQSTSTASPPSPHGKRPISPQHHFSPVSPLKVRKDKPTAFSLPLRSTPSTLTSSPRSETGSISPRSESPLFYNRHRDIPTSPSTPRVSSSPHRSAGSTRPLALRKNIGPSSSSPISLSQWQKPVTNPQRSRSPSVVLQEKSNSMEFV